MLYEDLTRTAGYLNWSDVCKVDPETLAWLAADVQDRRLRRDIIELCSEAVTADGSNCDREAEFLKTAARRVATSGANDFSRCSPVPGGLDPSRRHQGKNASQSVSMTII